MTIEFEKTDDVETALDASPEISETFMPIDHIEAMAGNAEAEQSEKTAPLGLTPDDDDSDAQAVIVMDPQMLKGAILGLVTTVNDMIADFAQVTPVSKEKNKALSDALYHLQMQYPDFNPASPKTMAWIGVGVACAGIYGPMVKERRAKKGQAEPQNA